MQKFFTFLIAMIVAGGGVFAVPRSVQAASFLTYSLEPGKVNANWAGYGPISITESPNGLQLITTTGTGIVMTHMDGKFSPDAVKIFTDAPTTTELLFAWVETMENIKSPNIVRLTMNEGKHVNTIDLTELSSWKSGSKYIGFVVAPHTSVTVATIEFTQWNVLEKFWSLLKSFWVFDGYFPYTINFVWGPQFALTPLGVSHLFQTLPPQSFSATFFANILLLLLLIIVILRATKMYAYIERKRMILRTILLSTGILWVLFDLRMGAEFLSYTKKDLTDFVFAPIEFQTLRERGGFYRLAEIAVPLVADRERYNFIAPQEWPYLGNIRYLTYPSLPSNRFDEDDTWVIFARPDFRVNEQQQLTLQGMPLTEPGTILAGPAEDGSLIFRGRPLPL